MGKRSRMVGGGLKCHHVQLWAGGRPSYMMVIDLEWIIWDKAAERQGGEPMRRTLDWTTSVLYDLQRLWSQLIK